MATKQVTDRMANRGDRPCTRLNVRILVLYKASFAQHLHQFLVIEHSSHRWLHCLRLAHHKTLGKTLYAHPLVAEGLMQHQVVPLPAASSLAQLIQPRVNLCQLAEADGQESAGEALFESGL